MLPQVETIKSYLVYKYLSGKYDPEALVYIPTFGDVSRSTINFLQARGVIDSEFKTNFRVNLRPGSFIAKPTTSEQQFHDLYHAAQTEMFKSFGHCIPEDVLMYIATGEKTQRHGPVTFSDMEEYVSQKNNSEEALADEDIEAVWETIKPNAIAAKHNQ